MDIDIHSILSGSTDCEPHNPTFCRIYRGKCAREIYRCIKGIVVTRSFIRPTVYALARIPAEISSGFILERSNDLGETIIAYFCSLGVLRYVYVISKVGKIKQIARFCYNFLSAPMSCGSFLIEQGLELCQISKLEKLWFGSTVPIYSNHASWAEGNFTVTDFLTALE